MIKYALITISLFLLSGSILVAGTESATTDLQIERDITEGKILAAMENQKISEKKDQILVVLGLIDDQANTIAKNDESRAEEMAKIRLQVLNTKRSLKAIWNLEVLESIQRNVTKRLQELNNPKPLEPKASSEEIPGTRLHPELGNN